MPKILVCGGAGYIGSHMARLLHQTGYEVVVLDNLSTGHRQAVRWGRLVEADILSAESLNAVFTGQNYDAVMHFSARSLVAQSVVDPMLYYSNNVGGTIQLLAAMHRHGINKIIFSSSAAVYGAPVSTLIDENHPLQPINPYGASKLMAERMLSDAAMAYGIRSVALRYFNAAGASTDGLIGEAHVCETHLIPNIINAVLHETSTLKIFGNDYSTPDGTCIRDYVHVDDLASAHLLALKFLDNHAGAYQFNLGNGRGFSVMDVIRAVEKISGSKLQYEVVPARQGDPASLIASSVRAEAFLGWTPKWKELEAIVESAWRWHKSPRY